MPISQETATPDLLQPVPWATRPREAGRLLVALTADRTAPRALQQGHAFAQRLGVELHLIRVVSRVDGAPRS